jgi:hypothetical protein
LVGRSQGSHTNLTLPLQFCHQGPPFPTLLRPAGHPQNDLRFWSVGHREVTRTSRCLFSFVTQARPSRPFYALWDTPKTALNFGRLVGRSVGQSQGSHMNVMLPIQFLHPGQPFPALLRPAGHPQNGLNFWSVGRLFVGKSHEPHAASSVLSPGPTLPDPSTPCGPPPKRP